MQKLAHYSNVCALRHEQTLAAEAVELEEAKREVRARELLAVSAAKAAAEEAGSATSKLARLTSERDDLAAAVNSLQVTADADAIAQDACQTIVLPACDRWWRHIA